MNIIIDGQHAEMIAYRLCRFGSPTLLTFKKILAKMKKSISGSWHQSSLSCWKLLTLASLLLTLLPFCASQTCYPYEASSFTSISQLRCSQRLTPCHQVTPSNGALSLDQVEDQLGNVLSQSEAGVARAELSRQCLDGFRYLYCLRIYQICGQDSDICEEDCSSVVNDACRSGGWMYLSRIIDQLRTSGLIQLQPLTSMNYCNVSLSLEGGQTCLSVNSVENCTISTTPPAPPTNPSTTPISSSLPSSTIIAAVVVVSFIFVTIVALTIAALAILTVAGYKRQQEPPLTPTNLPADRGTSHAEHPRSSLAERQDRRGTLMMSASTVHEALLDPTPPTRSTTLARRIKTSSFLCQPVKERLKHLEYPRGNICLVRDLWETNFGPVYLGEASGLDPSEDLSSVFIKSLRDRASQKLKQQFTLEMTWASGFSHAHVISLLGVCTKEEPLYMIYEHLDYGSLKEFLQSIGSMCLDLDQFLVDGETSVADVSAMSGAVFGVEDLTNMACQVADGMDYLAKKAFILKDLATRNCQVGQNLVVKIANFGLNYDRTSDDYCCIRSHKATPVPLRWLAPETLRHNRFSVYSDIWAYGVLLWEIFSFGARPYGDLTNAQVAKCILETRLLQPPEKCPDHIYELMKRCWSSQPSNRPWFHSIVTEFSAEMQEHGGEKRRLSTPDVMQALRLSMSN